MKVKRECRTKSGDELLLRSLGAADAGAALALCRRASGETLNLLRYADEWTISLQEEAAMLSRAEASPKSLMLGAFVGGQLVGIASFLPVHPGDRARHRAGVGIMILRAYWRQGIGSALMETLIEAAKKTSLEQLELNVVDMNKGAVALYKKHGFAEYGRHPRMIKYRDGRYADTLLMMLELRRKP